MEFSLVYSLYSLYFQWDMLGLLHITCQQRVMAEQNSGFLQLVDIKDIALSQPVLRRGAENEESRRTCLDITTSAQTCFGFTSLTSRLGGTPARGGIHRVGRD
jgi:hypothetical protein